MPVLCSITIACIELTSVLSLTQEKKLNIQVVDEGESAIQVIRKKLEVCSCLLLWVASVVYSVTWEVVYCGFGIV